MDENMSFDNKDFKSETDRIDENKVPASDEVTVSKELNTFGEEAVPDETAVVGEASEIGKVSAITDELSGAGKDPVLDEASAANNIDEVISRHSDSFTKAAEDIAGRKAQGATEDNSFHNTDNGENSTYEEFRRVAGGSNREHQSEVVRAGAFASQPEKGKGESGERKKKSKLGKAAGLVASAAVFGLIAGGTMVGVNRVADSYLGSSAANDAGIIIGSRQPQEGAAVTETVAAAASGGLSVMDVSPIVDSAMPSVVSIYGVSEITTNGWFGRQSYKAQSSGSGIIVGQTDSELLVVTNNHVIEDTKNLEVEFADGSKAAASIKGGDSENDVAVVAVKLSDLSEDTWSKISVANIGDSSDLKVGQGVVAIGNALGYGQSVTVGYISALNREIETEGGVTRNLLQTDAAINPGNSGGALLNMQGEVIGINSAKYADTEVEGMGYAIPISAVKELITELSSKETRTIVDVEKQGYLGIQGNDITAEMASAYDMPQGIYVYKIVEGGAAASSELREKDVITKFDSQRVKNMEELRDMLSYYESGRTVELTVQRLDGSGEYTEQKVSITLGARETQEQ